MTNPIASLLIVSYPSRYASQQKILPLSTGLYTDFVSFLLDICENFAKYCEESEGRYLKEVRHDILSCFLRR